MWQTKEQGFWCLKAWTWIPSSGSDVLRHVTSPWELRFLNGETELLLTVVLHCRGDLNDAIRAREELTFIVDYI